MHLSDHRLYRQSFSSDEEFSFLQVFIVGFEIRDFAMATCLFRLIELKTASEKRLLCVFVI